MAAYVDKNYSLCHIFESPVCTGMLWPWYVVDLSTLHVWCYDKSYQCLVIMAE